MQKSKLEAASLSLVVSAVRVPVHLSELYGWLKVRGCRSPRTPALRRHQLHTAVHCAAGVIGVGADGRKEADACGTQAGLRDAMVFH